MSSLPTLKTFLHPKYWYAWPALALILLMSWMPGIALWIIGRALGTVASWFPTANRHFAETNIRLCFPGMDPGDRRKLLQQHFRSSGFAMVSLGVAWFAPRWRVRKFITVQDDDILENARASGRNIILLAPHFVGLDMGGSRLAADRRWQFVSMYRKSRDPLLEYLFSRRSRFGPILVERMASPKPIIRAIREGRIFYYLPDQDMGERASVFVPFFGIPAATVTALSRMAAATGSVVIPCITRVLPAGRGFEMRFLPPLADFPSDDPVADAARMNREIEAWVREMPEQYMWTYRRFKTRPNGQESLYPDK